MALDYGSASIAVDLPEGDGRVSRIDVLEKAPVAPLADPGAALRHAIAEPIAGPPLRDLARGRSDAVVVVSDATRPVPNAEILPPLLEALAAGGLDEGRVTVQVATGLHRPATPAELERILGPALAARLRVVQHDARDAAGHVDLGRTSGGLPIHIDRFFVQSDLRIVTGLIEPHLMAGYSGGRKAVCPGLAAVDTIRVAHGTAMLEGPLGAGIVEGNPLHEALLEVARRVGVHFSANVSLDRERRISGVFCGELKASHAVGMRAVEAECEARLDRFADLVVVSAGGAPLDATFYQAIKGVAAAAGIVRPGGVILLCAALEEGLGSPGFEKCLRLAGSAEGFERRLGDPRFFEVDQWMVQALCQALRRGRVLLYSDGVPRATQRACFVEPVASPEEGVARGLEQAGPAARVAVLPQGPYVLATVRGRRRALGRGRAGP